MSDHLIPILFASEIGHSNEVSEVFRPTRGNFNAKAALEGSVLDLYARVGISLSKAWAGKRIK